MNKYLPYIISAAMFVLGYLIAPGDKVDVSQYEREREQYQKRIEELKALMAAHDSVSDAIRKKMKQDSAAYADALKRKETTIAILRGKINEVDFKNHTSADLDRIRAEILSARN
jgi:DNA gyrase/topoisomerase IV subunit A